MENYQPVAQEVIIVFEDNSTGIFFGPVAVDEKKKEEGVKVKEIYFIDLVSPPAPEQEEKRIIEPKLTDIERVNGPVD